MKCPKCQTDNPIGVSFCGACGQSLTQPAAQLPSSSPVAHWISVTTGLLGIAYGIAVILLLVVSFNAANSYPSAGIEGFGMFLAMGRLLVVPAAVFAIVCGVFAVVRRRFGLQLMGAVTNIIASAIMVSVFVPSMAYRDLGGLIWVAMGVTSIILTGLAVLNLMFMVLFLMKSGQSRVILHKYYLVFATEVQGRHVS